MRLNNFVLLIFIIIFVCNSFAETKIKTNIFTPPNKRRTEIKKEKINSVNVESFEIQAVINIGNNRKLLLKIKDKDLRKKLGNKVNSKGFITLRKGSSIDGYTYMGNTKNAVLFERNGKMIGIPLFLTAQKKSKATKNQRILAKKNIVTDKTTIKRDLKVTKPKILANKAVNTRKTATKKKNVTRNDKTRKVVTPNNSKSANSFVEIFKKAAENNNSNNTGSNPFMQLFK